MKRKMGKVAKGEGTNAERSTLVSELTGVNLLEGVTAPAGFVRKNWSIHPNISRRQ
ncbi:hypothetical protein I7I48_10431 [Histoplasma ohiense]|nr:hypothetical protein I7I48_10431 [Histoplasma ohiense (nom. inval.)]